MQWNSSPHHSVHALLNEDASPIFLWFRPCPSQISSRIQVTSIFLFCFSFPLLFCFSCPPLSLSYSFSLLPFCSFCLPLFLSYASCPLLFCFSCLLPLQVQQRRTRKKKQGKKSVFSWRMFLLAASTCLAVVK